MTSTGHAPTCVRSDVVGVLTLTMWLLWASVKLEKHCSVSIVFSFITYDITFLLFLMTNIVIVSSVLLLFAPS